MTPQDVASLDAARDALADVTVALLSLSPVLRFANPPAVAFLGDAAEAALRAHRHLTALRHRCWDEGEHSVRVEP